MRPHQHALLSLVYAGGITLVAGGNLVDTAIYVSAVLGGEIIDLVDHPLHFFWYGRHAEHVRESYTVFDRYRQDALSQGKSRAPSPVMIAYRWRESINTLSALGQGLRAVARHLNNVEDSRKITHLRLHNIAFLGIVSLFALLTSLFFFMPTYALVFCGAPLLHMITDVCGDFWLLGHADNWL